MLKAILFVAVIAVPACAQGWVFVKDDYTEVIQPTSTIVATLVTSRVKTKGTFLTKVDEVGIVLQANLTGRAKDSGGAWMPRQASFPLGYTAPNPDRNKDVANLAFENILIPSLTLGDAMSDYKNIQIKVSLVKVDETSAWGKVTKNLLGFAGAAKIPASPFSGAAQFVLDFANSTVNDALAGVGKETKIALGQRAINFQVNPLPKTGSYLLIDTPIGLVAGGNVNPDALNGRCFYLQQSGGATTIMVGNTVAGAADNDSDGCSRASYTPLLNPYIRILLQTQIELSSSNPPSVVPPQPSSPKSQIPRPPPPKPGTPPQPPPPNKSEDTRRQRVARQCEAAGVKEANCVALGR